MNELNIHFEFYHNSDKNNWNWTLLMRPNKKKCYNIFL